jgi:hypothetical protein
MSKSTLKRLWFKVAAAFATVAGTAVGFAGGVSAWDGNYDNYNNYDSHYQWCQSIDWQHESCRYDYNNQYGNNNYDDWCHNQYHNNNNYNNSYDSHQSYSENFKYNVEYSKSYNSDNSYNNSSYANYVY